MLQPSRLILQQRVIFPSRARAFSTTAPSLDASLDYYAILGVPKSASQKQIRLAYFNMAKKHHPDLNSHKSKADYEKSNRLFQQINDAYQVLSD